MVNRIDGNNYYDYQKLKNVNIPDVSEKFSLDYKQNELQSEAKEKKDKVEKTPDEQNLFSDKSGVKLEISSRGQSASAGSSNIGLSKSETKPESQSLVDTIRTFVSTAIEAVKDFFYKLWYDPQPVDADSKENLEPETSTADPMDIEDRHREIQQYIHKGDINQVINLLTDDGKKTIAKNSSLLTYYDKNGRVVELNASDREKILHGDGNVTKL